MNSLIQKKDNKTYIFVGCKDMVEEQQFKDHIIYVRQSCGGDHLHILAEKSEALAYLEKHADEETLACVKERINTFEKE